MAGFDPLNDMMIDTETVDDRDPWWFVDDRDPVDGEPVG